MPRACSILLFRITLPVVVLTIALSAQVATPSLTVLSREGRRTLEVVSVNNQDYVALDEVAAAFGAVVRDDRLAGGVTVTVGDRTMVLTSDQTVVSVAGRLVSLPSAPRRQGNRWLVPIDFLPRALAPMLNTRLDLRRAARLLVVGDLRVPRVVDPGHGGEEVGAQGTRGGVEKDVTLSIARRLRTLIESRLGLRVFLTRDDDRGMTLDERTAFANSHKADVFLSLHANAALRPAMKGAEVYYLSAERGESEGPRVMDLDTSSLPVLGGGTRSIDLILWDVAQTRYLEQSSGLAGFVEQALRIKVEMSPRAVQQAPFRVLVGANMPAVLVEMGYLSNPDQEAALVSAEYQTRMVEALLDGLVRYRDFVERTPVTAAGLPPRPPP
ncbi:MAG: N-acetylmuramoyl-L-alanine amidase [Acidobacteria bacterium]|nr:N-acetylmuramoyl-L-alanine amidase [Acidobacteriota bacterium]